MQWFKFLVVVFKDNDAHPCTLQSLPWLSPVFDIVAAKCKIAIHSIPRLADLYVQFFQGAVPLNIVYQSFQKRAQSADRRSIQQIQPLQLRWQLAWRMDSRVLYVDPIPFRL